MTGTQKPPATKAGQRKRRKTYEEDVTQCNVAPKNTNTLMIRVVLQNIFECLNAKDLRSCRLVNTRWNTEAIFHIKRRSDFINFGSHPTIGMVRAFFDCVISSRDFPFNKLHVSSNIWSYARNLLLKGFGSRLTSLKIYVNMKSGSLPKKFDFSNLTELEFSEHFYDRNDITFIPDLLEKFSGRLTSIKVNWPRTKILALLANLPGLRLSKLRIVKYDMWQSEMIEVVLAKHKHTLTHLELSSHGCNSWLKVAQMPQLQILKVENIIHFGKYEGDGIPFPSLTTFSYMSSKTKTETNSDQKLSVLFGEKPAPTVKSVQLSWSSTLTEAVSHLFPNVEQLRLSAVQANLLQIIEPMITFTDLEIGLSAVNVNLMNLLTGLRLKWESKRALARMEEEVGRKLEQSPYSVLHRTERIKLNYLETHKNLSIKNLLLPCRLLFHQMQNLRQLTIQHSKKKDAILSKRMQSVLEMLEQKVLVKWETV